VQAALPWHSVQPSWLASAAAAAAGSGAAALLQCARGTHSAGALSDRSSCWDVMERPFSASTHTSGTSQCMAGLALGCSTATGRAVGGLEVHSACACSETAGVGGDDKWCAKEGECASLPGRATRSRKQLRSDQSLFVILWCFDCTQMLFMVNFLYVVCGPLPVHPVCTSGDTPDPPTPGRGHIADAATRWVAA
jgi:hypothetical protein